MPKVNINGQEIEAPAGMSLLQACELAGAEIPRFCYHERLEIAGNCRMCLVEWVGAPKPQASCALSVGDLRPNPDGTPANIRTDSPVVKKAREGVMEFLLINHPLDCPICDQGGECDLQDQALGYGAGRSRYEENKRAVEEKHMGPLIKTIMTRCIHCTRCIRFATDVAGVPELGAVGRGEHMEITTYLEKTLDSELSGNVIDLCPVGALTSKPYAFTARPWELTKTESVDVMDALGSNIRIDARGKEVMRVLPRLHEDVNEEWISDKTRYACDGLMKQRLDRPYVRKGGKLQEASWNAAFEAIATGLKGLSGEEIAGVVGDLCDMESMFALKGLLALLGSDRIECRQDGAKLESAVRASYLFNTTIAGIEDADAILLIGTNPRLEAAVLNARIRKTWLAKKLPIANIGPAYDLTYPVEQLGDNAAVVADILAGKNGFADILKKAERPMLILGQGALAHEDGGAVLKAAHDIADQFGFIKEGWNGFNVLHTAASRVGALDLGLTVEGGLEGLLKDAKAVFLLGADEFDAAPLKKSFTVYLGSHGDRGVQEADVVLPGAAYSEKSGTYLNTEGRAQMAPRAIFPPGDAREDWTILRALSDVLGKTLPYDSLPELRAKMNVTVIDEAPREGWGDFGAAGKIAKGGIQIAVTDFYGTNPIARASDTMAACRDAKLADLKEGTGTDG